MNVHVPGVGTSTINKIQKQFNIQGNITVSILRQPRIWSTLSRATQIALDMNPTINFTRKTATQIIKSFPDYVIISGSYRRQVTHQKDIDVIILENNITNFISWLDSHNFVYISRGNAKIAGYLHTTKHGNIKMDIFITNRISLPFMEFYATGDKTHNIIFRGLAKKRGLTLNQHGIFNTNGKSVIRCKNENDIYTFFNHEYIPPEGRNKYTLRFNRSRSRSRSRSRL